MHEDRYRQKWIDMRVACGLSLTETNVSDPDIGYIGGYINGLHHNPQSILYRWDTEEYKEAWILGWEDGWGDADAS